MQHTVEDFREPESPVGRVAELFAGVGGFRLGLARAGWITVFSNQWEPSTRIQHASDVYLERFGGDGHSNEDISVVESIPEDFDLLVGGFPCQDYSVAKSLSTSTGLAGKKGVLWWEILRLVMLHKPKRIFLENVDRLLKSPSSQRGRDFAVMLSTLGNAGYVAEWRVVNSADYGYPQRRIRVFIVATRKDINRDENPPEIQILKTGVLAEALPLKQEKLIVNTIEIGDQPQEVSASFNLGKKMSPFLDAGVFHDGVAYTAKVEASFDGERRTLADVLVDDDEVPIEYWIDEADLPQWVYLKGAKNVERVHKVTGFKYSYSEGKMTFPDALDRPSRTILTGEGGTTPSRFKHVVRTGGGFRRLLPIELERLCGFPDNWTSPEGLGYKVTDGRRAFFMGNALVVGLIEQIGLVLGRRAKAD